MSLRSYAELLASFRNLGQKYGIELLQLGRVDGYELVGAQHSEHPPATAESDRRPSVLVMAGLHGDEVAGVYAAVEWFEHQLVHGHDRFDVTVVPCLNPYGFEHNTRYDGLRRDPNRWFGSPGDIRTEAVSKLFEGKTYDIIVDLHEDWERHAFYVYELKTAPPFLGSRLVQRLQSRGWPVSHGEIVDEFHNVTERGVIRTGCQPTEPCKIPETLLCRSLYRELVDHVLCVETPMQFELEQRILMHRQALSAVCEFVSQR